MKHTVEIKIPSLSNITLELDDANSPKTVNDFIEKLPFTVELNVWGDEIYSSESPISQPEENAKTPVNLNDVAYWPTGKAICLFYGPTPIGKSGEITPASPVNILGTIISPNKSVLDEADGKTAEFSLKS
ncbi:MAG: cyclophilin-like fold protein [Nitrosopumilus sp.]